MARQSKIIAFGLLQDMNILGQFKKVTTFAFDVDGVLTDGTLLLTSDGLQARQMHIRDGLALQMAIKAGYRVIIISGAYSEPVVKRMHYLGLTDVFTAIKNKKEFLLNFLSENNIATEQVLFMGDDLPDVPTLQTVGIGCCPADAAAEVKTVSHYISPINGGYGCVRDVIEKVLKLNDHWNFDTEVTSK
ncbi:MAG: 3-deoxy-D-manno-octulosonate 8-phosphate phosphatase [Flaviaesturariibacter sp.]|nr:3-deoxy-D-manno-octulosonate 8-phosphate phosphatase [Flaviaesturariibacter sp.]